ncbi:hypothetical protein GCM10010280_27390 [Streptomyces pilosus]|uniref:Gliding motility protein n=1 Tax=Streptomyces pilosus TaxID=28893 RepID=A0A918BM73_9ACTN|nr:hypothetical protein GCM10010280_27390 [Streptomyces pilosus]
MGVFARLFQRSSKAGGETRAAEARADAPASGPAAQDTAGTAEPKGSDVTPETAVPSVTEDGGASGAETVDIPKQQSTEAAGSDAGEGART